MKTDWGKQYTGRKQLEHELSSDAPTETGKSSRRTRIRSAKNCAHVSNLDMWVSRLFFLGVPLSCGSKEKPKGTPPLFFWGGVPKKGTPVRNIPRLGPKGAVGERLLETSKVSVANTKCRLGMGQKNQPPGIGPTKNSTSRVSCQQKMSAGYGSNNSARFSSPCF